MVSNISAPRHAPMIVLKIANTVASSIANLIVTDIGKSAHIFWISAHLVSADHPSNKAILVGKYGSIP
jgi:hypothetical protein